MGFRSKSKVTSKATAQTRNINPFKVGGLIFESEDDYQLFKDIDKNISQTVKSVVIGEIDIKDVFNNIKKNKCQRNLLRCKRRNRWFVFKFN